MLLIPITYRQNTAKRNRTPASRRLPDIVTLPPHTVDDPCSQENKSKAVPQPPCWRQGGEKIQFQLFLDFGTSRA
jgi:hypothetical protein